MNEEEIIQSETEGGSKKRVIPSFDEAMSLKKERQIPSFDEVMSEGSEEDPFIDRIYNEFSKGSYQRTISEKVKSLVSGRETVFYDKNNQSEDDYKSTVRGIDDSELPPERQISFSGRLGSGRNFKKKIGSNRQSEIIEDILKLQEDVSKIPSSKAMGMMADLMSSDKGTVDKIGDLTLLAGSHPSLIPELISNSVGSGPESLALGFVGALGGPIGIAAGSFIGTLSSETANSYLSVMNDLGIDISDPESLRSALLDEELKDEIKAKVTSRGVAVATTDALLSMATAGISKGISNTVAKTAFATGSQMAGEGISELAGQAAAGSDIDVAEAYVESIAGAGGAVTESLALLKDGKFSKAADNLDKSQTDIQEESKNKISNNPEESTLEDVKEALATGDADIDLDVDEALNNLEESSGISGLSDEDLETMLETAISIGDETTVSDLNKEIERRNSFDETNFSKETEEVSRESEKNYNETKARESRDSGEQGEFSRNEKEISGLGDEGESSSEGVGRQDNNDLEASDINIDYLNKDETSPLNDEVLLSLRKEPSLKESLKLEAKDRANDYTNLSIDEGAKDKKYYGKLHKNAVEVIDSFSASMEEVIGNMSENSKNLRSLLARDFVGDFYTTLSNVNTRDKNVSSIIEKHNSKDIDREKVGMYAYLKIDDGVPVSKKIENIRKSASNADQERSFKKKIADKLLNREGNVNSSKVNDFVSEFNDKGDLILNKKELDYYNDVIENISKESSQRRMLYAEMYGKDIKTFNNYVPLKIKGFTSRKSQKESLKNLDSPLEGEEFYNQLGTPASKRTKGKKGPGDAYYDFNMDVMFQRGMSELHMDQELAPQVYKVKQLLNNEKFIEKVGKENASYIADRVKNFIQTNKGLTQKKRGEIERGIQNTVTSVKRAYLSNPAQIVKQFVPGAAGVLVNYAGSPKAAIKGARMALKASDSWVQENAPGLFLRKESLDHLTESSLKQEKKSLSSITSWLGLGDYSVSKLLFFTDYAKNGGTLENKSKVASNLASIKQARSQGTNSLSMAPPQYSNQSLALQTLLPFSMMPMNVSRQILRNINPAKLGNKDRRAQLAMGLMNIAVFQVVSEATRELYDEFDDWALGEDEDDEMIGNLNDLINSEEVHNKILVKSAMDAALGFMPSPVQNTANEYVFQPMLKELNAESDYVDDSALSIHFGGDNELVAATGIVGSIGEDITKATDAMMKAAESGDKDAMMYSTLYALEMGMTLKSRNLGRLGPAYGLILRQVRSVKNSYKDEFKESVKELEKDKKESEISKVRGRM